MSDDKSLAIQEPKQKPALAKGRKRKTAKASQVEAPRQVAQPPGQSLVQVAVTAADAELETAKRAYAQQKQENVVAFFDFVREEQSSAAIQLEDAVLGFYGLTRNDLYELPQPVEGA